MDIRQLEYFLAVVDHGGVSRAAIALHVAQPSLSQSIRNLERELKVELFHRVGRGVVLSPAGVELVGPARQAVRSLVHVADVVRDVRSLSTGRLDLCALPGLAADPVAAWIGYFRRRYPSVAVRMEESDDVEDIVELVRSGGCEVGFLTSPRPLADLAVQELAEQHLVLVRPPGTGAEPMSPIAVSALGDVPVIVDGRSTSGWTHIENVLHDFGVDITVAAEVRHPSSTLHLVLAGAGATFMPMRLALRARRAGAVIQPLEPAIIRTLGMVYRPVVSPAARAFVDMCIQDAGRWVAATTTCRAAGMSYAEAAMHVDDDIWHARLTTVQALQVGGPRGTDA